MSRACGAIVLGLAAGAASQNLFAGAAMGQSAVRAAFTANNGNLEGSVTVYTFNADNSLHFVQKYVTGSTPSTSMPVPGTNANAITITPNGKYLCISHATGNNAVEQLTILRVNSDATVSPFATFTTPDSPLDVEWINDEYLAVTKTSVNVTNQVLVYRFADTEPPTLTLVDDEDTAGFTSGIAVHPNRPVIYAQSTSGNQVMAFEVNGDGTLDLINGSPNGSTFPLGPGVSPDGTKLYTGGGTSSGGHAVSGWTIDGTGALTPMTGTPFTSPGTSPKQVVVSSDNLHAFAAHGTDATVRSFNIDQATGALTSNGFSFDVGITGSLGEIAVFGELLLVGDRDTIVDGVQGLRCFTINADGSMTQNGTIVDTQGTVGPNSIAAWEPAPICPGDIGGGKGGGPDGNVDIDDFSEVMLYWGTSGPEGDTNEDGAVDTTDLSAIVLGWGDC